MKKHATRPRDAVSASELAEMGVCERRVLLAHRRGPRGTGGEHFIRIVNCVIDHKPLRPGLGFASVVRVSNLEAKVAHLALQAQYLLQRMQGVLSAGDLTTLASSDKLIAVTDGVMDGYWTGLDLSVDARRWFSDEEVH